MVGVVCEQLGDQVLRLGGDVLPAGFREGVLANAHLFHNLLVAVAVEGGHSRKDDVQDDSARPDVALLVIFLIEDLGRDVVRRAEFFIKRFAAVEDEGGSEVYNFNLIEVLVLLE